MCGICGEWNAFGADAAGLERMNGALVHRGPDDQGAVVLGEVGLAMRRLSIIDLSGGHQPIANEDSTAFIVFNGEIYNHRELRRHLVSRGHVFRTDSDTEVILHLYEERGERVVEELRGMFAFAIWDTRRRRLLLARDRFGQKPLFYRFDGRRFLFASEIKSILAASQAAGEPAPKLDLQALDEYLTLRFVPSPRTLFAGIQKLPAAHVLTLDAPAAVNVGGVAGGALPGPAMSAASGPRPAPRIEVRRYWRLSYVPKRSMREADAVEEARYRIKEAIESHLISDVPVGAFLSGGMDSSLVTAMMAEIARERGAQVPTFAIGVEDNEFNELPYARQVADHCGTDHHEEVVWPDMVSLLPTMVYHLDEPSDPIAACMYHSAALAARHVKVVLTGDGGDEVFAGYDRYFGFRWVDLYAAVPEVVRRRAMGPLLASLPDRAGYKNWTQKARWVHELSFQQGGRRYAQATAFFRFGQQGKGGLYTPDVAAKLTHDAMESVVRGFQEAVAEDDLDRMLQADISTRLAEHSLMLTDRMTMSQSLEGRSPFLDHRLAEFVAPLSTDLKMRGKTLKYLLRKVAQPYLPEPILKRPKQGFMFPLAYWMKGPLLPVMRRLLRDAAVLEEGIFQREAVERLLAEHLADKADHHVRLWLILNVEVWFRLFVRREPLDDLAGRLRERAA